MREMTLMENDRNHVGKWRMCSAAFCMVVTLLPRAMLPYLPSVVFLLATVLSFRLDTVALYCILEHH